MCNLDKHVAVGEVRSFGKSHRTARVDDAEDVVGMDHLDLVIHPAEVFALLAETPALVNQVVPVDGVLGQAAFGVYADDELELAEELPERVFQFGDGIDEEDFHLGIVALELEIFGRDVREERDGPGVVYLDGDIGQDPFRRTRGDDADALAGAEAAAVQGDGDRYGGVAQFVARIVDPLSVNPLVPPAEPVAGTNGKEHSGKRIELERLHTYKIYNFADFAQKMVFL